MDKTFLERDLRGNAAMFDSLESLLASPEIYTQIDSLLITAAASPIASVSHNEGLSIRRAETMKHYILRKHPDFPKTRIHTSAIGIDWDGFKALIEAEDDLPSRDKILLWLNSKSLMRTFDTGTQSYLKNIFVLHKLRTSDAGTQTYLKNVIYPQLQYASVRLKMKDGSYIPPGESSPLRMYTEQIRQGTATLEESVPVAIHDTIYVHDTVWLHDTIWATKEREYPYPPALRNSSSWKMPPIALGSNLLYDVVLVPNLYLEAVLSPHISASVQGIWMWWDNRDPNYLSYRIQALWAEARYWLNPQLSANGNYRPLSGWYAGVYGSLFNYDIRLFKDNPTDYGNLSRDSYSVGLTCGYSHVLNRSLRVNFSLGLGYATGTYYLYDYSHNSEKYIQRDMEHLHYFGPTQAGVSLVWLITGKGDKK
ncbi:hypothetical protein AGMMS49525_13340 [Bacteroidia bacterium]|nr:hypothetical protein AGMMS49525_13340 [Bacteroidia bacterium]